MKHKLTTLWIAVLATAIDAQLLCYQCDDCASSRAVVQPCGFEGLEKANTLYPPNLTPPTGLPQYPQNPWDPQYPQYPQYPQDGNQPLLTPPVWPNTVPPLWNEGLPSNPNIGGGVETTYWPGMTNTEWWNTAAPWNPSTVGGVSTTYWPGMTNTEWWNTAAPWNPPLVGGVSTTYWPPRQAPLIDSEAPAWKSDGRYACVMTKPTVNDRQLVRLGCTLLGPSLAETCKGVIENPDEHCKVCTSHLCNTGA